MSGHRRGDDHVDELVDVRQYAGGVALVDLALPHLVDPLLLGDDDVAVDGGDRQRDDVDEVVWFPFLLLLAVFGTAENVGDIAGG